MYPVYETDWSVRTEIEEWLAIPEFSPTDCISEFVVQLEELMWGTNPTSYGPTEPHLRLEGKIPPKTYGNGRETSERKAKTHSYDDLGDLLIELAMERENDSHMHGQVSAQASAKRDLCSEKSWREVVSTQKDVLD